MQDMTDKPQSPALEASAPLEFAALYAEAQPVLLGNLRRKMYGGVTAGASSGAVDYWNGLHGVQPEDLAQEAWLRFWQVWHERTFPNRQAAYAYLFRISHNLFVDHLRRHRMLSSHGQIRLTDDLFEIAEKRLVDESADAEPDAALIYAETTAELYAAIESVLDAAGATPQRNVARDRALLDAWMDDTPLRVVADQLGMSVGAVKTRQWRIRTLVSLRFQRSLSDEPAAQDVREEVAV